MTVYLWFKTFHLVFVIAWMAAVFYLPRILVNLAEAGEAPAVRERLLLMARRLYGFGRPLPSARALSWFNELPLPALIAIVWLVLAKPF